MTIVRKTLADIPPITEARAAELRALAERPDSEIDYSDIPPSPDGFWDNAIRGRFYRPTKTQITVRIDADVLHWLRAGGDRYQTRLNAILREAMLRDLQQARATDQPAPVDQKEPAASDA